MFSDLVDEETLLNISARCDAPVFGDVLSWDDVISRPHLAPSLRQSVCDGMDKDINCVLYYCDEKNTRTYTIISFLNVDAYHVQFVNEVVATLPI